MMAVLGCQFDIHRKRNTQFEELLLSEWSEYGSICRPFSVFVVSFNIFELLLSLSL